VQLVLLVDDDVLVRAASARALGKLPSIEVIEASGVAEATQLIRSLRVDLLVADIEFGDGTMLDVLPEVTERGIPVVLISSQGSRFAQHLPSGLDIHAKPVSPMTLCQVVTTRLGCDELRTMFSLADYVQLASIGQRSLALEVIPGSEPVGSVVILRGEAWSARDRSGDGIDAFARLIAEGDATTSITPAPRVPGARNLDGSCQHLLLEAARRHDEGRAAARGELASDGARRAGPPPGGAAPPAAVANPARTRRPAIPSARLAAASSAPPSVNGPPIPTALAEGTGAVRPAVAVNDRGSEFDQWYALGIEALLARRYREAFDSLSRANQIRTTASIAANLKRLRELGFA